MKRPPVKPADLLLVIFVVAGILLYWTQLDATGYLLYSSLIFMTLSTVIPQVFNKDPKFTYSKALLIGIAVAIVITGIDRMTFQSLNPLVFPICFLFYIILQPKPAWIIRP